MDSSESSYQLGAGDEVRISIFGEPNLTGQYKVDGNGYLALPLIGGLQARGLSADELEKKLRASYAEYLQNPDINVEILNYRPFYIVGEVNQPGKYPYVDGMTVINAVAIAGGFTYRANTDAFYIQRRSDTGGRVGAQQATTVRPGDVIVVRERFF